MDSLDLIRTFHEVVLRGSFSAAARTLDMSPANVSKYVAALEARFGVRLFHRTTRRITLTDAGQLLYERSGPVLEMVHLTREELLTRAGTPSGRLYLVVPHALLQSRLPDALGRFLAQHPKVSLHLRTSDRQVDLVEEGIDLALRVGAVPDANLIVRRLLPVHFVVAATPAYWDAHGRPAQPQDLLAHSTLSVGIREGAITWPFVEGKRRYELEIQPRVATTDATPVVTLALQGLGVVYLPRIMLEEHLQSGALEPVLQPFMTTDLYLYAAYAQRRHNSAALKALLTFLEEETQQWFQTEAAATALNAPATVTTAVTVAQKSTKATKAAKAAKTSASQSKAPSKTASPRSQARRA